MKTLRERFSQYTGSLRSWKGAYVVHNLLNWEKLVPNIRLYKKYKVRKSIFSPIGKKDFKTPHQDIPWLDQADALEKLVKHPDWVSFNPEEQASIRQFVKEGFLILPGFFKNEKVDALNKDMDALLGEQKVKFNYSGRKVMDAFRHSQVADQDFFRNERLLGLLNFIMGKPVIPFQTINFIQGSEQRAHSDSIHMTTEPEGYLIAMWIALEDIQTGSGELFYYPGSHRLPFISTEKYNSGNTRWRIGNNSNKKYEDKIAEVVAENQLKKETFLAKKGDLLLWHANLLHGGSPIDDPKKTRRSMVAHYFCDEVICFHEMTQRPALLNRLS